MTNPLHLTITALGNSGDGLAHAGGQRYFVPYTVPGDVITAQAGKQTPEGQRAAVLNITTPGPDRVTAPCPHFTQCGGCNLQHLNDKLYQSFKLGLLTSPLTQAGFDVEKLHIRPLFMTPPASRRRADFIARHTSDGVVLGFMAAGSHQTIPLEQCPVTTPEIVAALPALRATLAGLSKPGDTAGVLVTSTATGLDVVLQLPTKTAPATVIKQAAPLLATGTLARLSSQLIHAKTQKILGEPTPILQEAAPEISFGGYGLTPPPGSFLQATAPAQEQLIASVLAGLKKTKKRQPVADLFAGCGTFSLPLAGAGYKVTAVEMVAEPLTALHDAANRHGLGDRLTALKRDLAVMPLSFMELENFAAVVLDPPRAGAKAQVEQLARSTVKTVLMVSCNPRTFSRDAHILTHGGYRLDWLQPVDQFRWSTHLEVVACFTRR